MSFSTLGVFALADFRDQGCDSRLFSRLLGRLLAVLLSLLLILPGLAGCQQQRAQFADDDRLSIVCTVFASYDWTRQILGAFSSDVSLSFLYDSGVDLHSFQPSIDDMVQITKCDLLIYVGGESDDWLYDAIAQSSNSSLVSICLLDILGDSARYEEPSIGSGGNDGGNAVGGGDAVGSGSDKLSGNNTLGSNSAPTDIHPSSETETSTELELDEHVWLSLRNAQVFCLAICEALTELDATHAAHYTQNTTDYIARLTTLDSNYQSAVNASAKDTILVADRFPFCYLASDYGLAYHAAFSGCSADTEASLSTIIYLADWINQLELEVVLVTESSNQAIARTVISNTGSKDMRILVLNSMQSVTAADAAAGANYLDLASDNLEVLKEALK